MQNKILHSEVNLPLHKSSLVHYTKLYTLHLHNKYSFNTNTLFHHSITLPVEQMQANFKKSKRMYNKYYKIILCRTLWSCGFMHLYNPGSRGFGSRCRQFSSIFFSERTRRERKEEEREDGKWKLNLKH